MKTITNSPVPVLLDLVKSQQWEQVIKRCKIATRKEFLCQDSNSFLQTPLHLALRFKAPIDVIRSFVNHKYFNKVMEMKDTYCGYQPLHSAVRYRATSTVISLLISKTSNQSKSKSNGSLLLEQHDRNGTNPLHIACMFGSPLEIIQVLVRANPLLLNMPTSKGKSVLFLATECSRIGPESLAFLLQQTTSACNDKEFDNYRGFTPLHMACVHDRPLEVLSLLVQSDPTACFQKTLSNQTPLASYFAHGSSREIVKLLLGPMDMDGNNVDCDGFKIDCGVIHRVLRFPQNIPDLLEFSLSSPGDGEKLHLGKLPLHVAISLHSRSCTRWRQILLQYPCAIHVRDDDFLYPFMIASKFSFVDVAFELLCAAPDVMMVGLEHLMPLKSVCEEVGQVQGQAVACSVL